jgi:hypothetical protein
MYGYSLYLYCLNEKRQKEYYEHWKKYGKEEQKLRIKESKINNTLLRGKKAFIFNEKDYLDYIAKYVLDKQKKRKK